MKKLLELYNTHINGKKTNMVVCAIVLLAFLHGTGLMVVPTAVWSILGGAGLAALRDGVKKIEAAVTNPQEPKVMN